MRLLLLSILAMPLWCFAQLPPKTAYDYDIKQIHSGHSLTDPLFHPWPGQYKYLMTEELGAPWDNIGKSTIPGSPLHWRWDHGGDVSPDARADIGDWELLVITEGVPLFIDSPNMQGWEREGLEGQRDYFSQFVNNAWNNGDNGNGAPTLLWTTWTNIDDSDGPWRELLDIYETEWQNMQDYANANRPAGAPPVYIIPGHRMMARIYDDIQIGLVPGIDTIADLFSDNIHLNELGAYAMAMIHYACLFNDSPVGLPANLFSDPNNEFRPSDELAAYFQRIVWEEVTGYPERTGIGVISGNPNQLTNTLDVFPNPSNNMISVKGVDVSSLELMTLSGEKIQSSTSSSMDISNLIDGVYMLKVNAASGEPLFERVVKQ